MKSLNIHNMKRVAASALAMAAVAAPALGETVSQKEALRLAQTFFNAANGQVMGKPNLVYNGKHLTTDKLFSPFYVYNLPAGGFVIISAENKAMPILGYSLKSSFDPDAMGEATKALLGEYARDIEMIRYDSRVPEEAIAAWTDYRAYVASMLSARYDATDPAFSMADAGERVRNIETSGRMEDFSSDIFTPEQWREEINAELRANKSVALGIFGGKGVEAAIIHGRKGDYYRMELDSRNDWLMRLMATEYLSEGQIADRGEVAEIVDEDEEERPFSLYEDFLAGVAREEDERQRMLDERLIPTEPAVRVIGGRPF